jgi:hypothetical protein
MFCVIYPSKNTSLMMVTTEGRNMWQAMVFLIQKIYISAHALVGCISHNESLVHGHESSKINTVLTKVN